ncbi:alpha/beta fold hydrolase [Rufibacter aurantiacus]|uniref:alpha/beta fold hydrolase n=1 Tax=Rufibacter aurantiacus TaxID=2817374 RepID=UPI001B312919|nr:alpha/beta hydrolase [Rufibacter aurantiacus]
MKTGLLLLLSFLIFSGARAQRMDSIKYAHGYLYFHTYGSGEPIIVLTGGPGANYQQLEEVAVNLGKKQHRAILLEQRGTGRSMPQPFDTSTINLRAAHSDLNLLLDHLKLKQAHFLGHSWGAMLAMSFATAYPARVKSLMLVDPGPFKLDRAVNETYSHNREARLNPQDRQALAEVSRKVRSLNATPADQELYYKWELIPVLYDRTQVDTLITKINKGALGPKMGGLMFQDLSKKGFDLSRKLPLFTKPIHIITGSQDPGAFVSYELKILLPKAHLHWIDKSGHFPMYEQTQQFYATLDKILNPNP